MRFLSTLPLSIILAVSLLLSGCGSSSKKDDSMIHMALLLALLSQSSAEMDTTAPTASIALSTTAVLPDGEITATVTFSEAVSGLDPSDFSLFGGTVGALTAVNPSTYTLAITAGASGTTVLEVSLPTGAAQDAAGNHSLASGSAFAAVAYAPWASASGTDTYGVWADLSVTGHGEMAVQRFRLIVPGNFLMGSPSDEPGRFDDETQHAVTISDSYWIADTSCTQRLWKAVMNTTPSFHTEDGLDLPVERVTHNDVQGFLTAMATLKPDMPAMLPTEAQWEYAARAGTTTPFSIILVSTDTINCRVSANDPYISTGTTRGKPVVVKSLPANSWGLYEVHGNVFDLCSDWYQEDLGSDPVTDPEGPASGSSRVIRGGGWSSTGRQVRSARRSSSLPSNVFIDVGFRLAASNQPAGGG